MPSKEKKKRSTLSINTKEKKDNVKGHTKEFSQSPQGLQTSKDERELGR